MSWKDADGREWSTAVNIGTVRRVKELTGTLLTDAADTDLIERLNIDVMLLADVLYAVCQPICVERSISSAQFGELLAGTVIDRACASLMQDIVDFFPSGRREIVMRISQAATRLEVERTKLLESKLTTEQFNKLILEAAEKAGLEIDRRLAKLGVGSGKSPEPLASTPAD